MYRHRAMLACIAALLASLSAITALPVHAADSPADWANLARYQAANAALRAPAAGEQRVVFIGDSITDGWDRAGTGLFANPAFINRGISGQTTPQMLVRFRPDVLALRPRLVVILAGTNDIAGNTGTVSDDFILGNIVSMAELARANGIRPILCSMLPAASYWWRKEIEPAQRIVALNRRIRDYAAKSGIAYIDYHSAMADEHGGLRRAYGEDGVHPNAAGYAVMEALAEPVIRAALNAP